MQPQPPPRPPAACYLLAMLLLLSQVSYVLTADLPNCPVFVDLLLCR